MIDMPEVEKPLPGGAVDVIWEMWIARGWGIRPESGHDRHDAVPVIPNSHTAP